MARKSTTSSEPPRGAAVRAGGAGRLTTYRGKRRLARSGEPAGTRRGEDTGRFVVHKHAARRLHYDLRLEHAGVLKSWAVPKGPSLDPRQRRLAVQVEDHPVEYAGYEGVIPAGEYGAGPTIVWDMGRWTPVGDVEEGLARGKLDFGLNGYKLQGGWALVRSRDDPKSWWLVKKRDAFATRDGGPGSSEESVLSGLTTDELREGAPRGSLAEEAERAGARHRVLHAPGIGLMLARTAERPFTRSGWLFELKYDGYRMLAERDGDRASLLFRRGQEVAARFPEIALALRHLPFGRVVLDAEVTVVDETGRPVFQRLQQRALLTNRIDVERAAVQSPATLFVFDLLALEGLDLRPLPLATRKRLLARVLPKEGPLRYVDHIERQGEAFFAAVRERGLEGVMAKLASSAYRAGRSSSWLKLRGARTGDFVVVGFTRGKGARAPLGALHLGVYAGGRLEYAGKVGSGFAQEDLTRLEGTLRDLAREEPAAGGERLPRDAVWVEPRLVVEVRFREWTDDCRLRQPVFLRLRPDKAPRECVRDETRLAPAARGASARAEREANPPRPAAPPPRPTPAPVGRQIRLTNLDKLLWPEDGYSKGDLIAYYDSVAEWILPYLRDRPVVITRYPDGIHGKSFFQKNAGALAADWMHTVRLHGERAGRDIEYLVCDDVETLRWLANLAAVPLHVWASRLTAIDRPDWCVLDLDRKQAPFAHVVRVARAVEALCREVGLPSFVKTSGGSGLHVLLPLGGQLDFAQCRTLAELLARVVEMRLPEVATTERSLRSRGGRVYIDYLQNGAGKLIAAPFCVRPLPGAPVSTPLARREVGSRLDPSRFDMRSVPRRMRRLGRDPMAQVLESRPDLAGALATLARLL